MSREIKFRYRFTDGENWIMTTYDLGQIINGQPYDDMSDILILKKYKHVGEDQFTGLRDKKGAEIYDGDILEDNGVIITTKRNNLTVEFRVNEAAFAFKEIPNYAFFCVYANRCEIIGNIYQHPELIKP